MNIHRHHLLNETGEQELEKNYLTEITESTERGAKAEWTWPDDFFVAQKISGQFSLREPCAL